MLTKEQIILWISKFRDGDITNPEYQKRLIDTFINAVFIDDDELTITFNWKNGTKTVTLAELEAADKAAGTGTKIGELLRLEDFKSSYLNDNAPPEKACNFNELRA